MATNSEPSTSTEISPADLTLLDTFEKSNTKKSTQWAITTWNNWRTETNNQQESPEYVPTLMELMQMTKPEIDKQMARFVLDLKRLGGEDYPIDSIKGIVFGMQRYAKAYGSYHDLELLNIIGNDYDFPKFNKAFRDKKKVLKEELYRGNLDRKRAQGISIAQEEALWDMGIFGCHSARALSDTVFFYVTKIFGFISGTSLRLLKTEHFLFSQDEYGKYVELDKNYSKEEFSEQLYNRCHGIEIPGGALRQYCDASNPRTFYNILKFYIEKLADHKSYLGNIPQNKQLETYLFMTPKYEMNFCLSPIGKNMLQQKFTKIMKSAAVEGYYTNQSLVQSIGPRLQAKGYNVKKQSIFQPLDHLEICKILDPPPGLINTANIQTQTKAILQLVSIPPGGTSAFRQSLQTGNGIPNQLPLVIQQGSGQQPSPTFQFTSSTPTLAVSAGSQASQTSFTATAQSPAFVLQQSLNQQFGNQFNIISSAVSQTTNTPQSQAQLSIEQGPDNKFQLTLKPISKIESTCKFVPNQGIPSQSSSTCQFVTMPSTETPKSGNGNTIDTDHSEHGKPDTKPADPLFFNQSHSFEKEHEEPGDKSELCNIIIKQEPVDYNGDYGENVDNEEITNDMKGNGTNEDSLKSHKVSERSSDRIKRKQTNEMIAENEKTGKKIRAEETVIDSTAETDREEHFAEIEYSFSNNLDKKSMRQEVSITDDDQSVFSFSGTNKMGKTISDLDLNLKDYFPDNCLIRPADIDLKRVITAEGGKMVIKIKYSVT